MSPSKPSRRNVDGPAALPSGPTQSDRHQASVLDASLAARARRFRSLRYGHPPGAGLRIHLFGRVVLFLDDRRLPAFETAKARELFTFLALNRGRLHPRDTLMGLLWGERPDPVARKNLRTSIWRVRRILEPEGVGRGTFLIAHRNALGLNADSEYWLDVEEFEQLLDGHEGCPGADLDDTAAGELRRAVSLYRGDLLEELFEDWCLIDRERLRARLLETLERLMGFHAARDDLESAIAYGRRILSLDPLREHVHREVMRYHYCKGDRPAALAQFQRCADLLEREMDIEPMRETTNLRRAIQAESVASGGVGPLPHSCSPPDGADLQALIAEIEAALEESQEASARLRELLRRLGARSPGP